MSPSDEELFARKKQRIQDVLDGAPAFPCKRLEQVGQVLGDVEYSGMSLRDYFAGQALAGIVTGMTQRTALGMDGSISLHPNICLTAYRLADTMLRIRGLEEAPDA